MDEEQLSGPQTLDCNVTSPVLKVAAPKDSDMSGSSSTHGPLTNEDEQEALAISSLDIVLDSSMKVFKESMKASLSHMLKQLFLKGSNNTSIFDEDDENSSYISGMANSTASAREAQLKECVMTLIAENNTLNAKVKQQQSSMLELQRSLVREKISRSELIKRQSGGVVSVPQPPPAPPVPGSASKLNSAKATATSNSLWQDQGMGFGFYNNSKEKNVDDEPEVEKESHKSKVVPAAAITSSSPSITPFRNSFMDQLLPSSLLDSPARKLQEDLVIEDDAGDFMSSANSTDSDAGSEVSNSLTFDRTSCQACSSANASVDDLSSSTSSEGSVNKGEFQCFPCLDVLCKPCVDQALLKGNHDVLKSAGVTAASALMACPVCDKPVLDVKFLVPPSAEKGEKPSSYPHVSTSQLSDIETVLDRFDGDIQKSIDYLLAEYSHAQLEASQKLEGPNATPVMRSASTTCGPVGGPSLSNWKTEICIYYLQGKCSKNKRTCSFAHGDSDLVKPITSNASSSLSNSLASNSTLHGSLIKQQLQQQVINKSHEMYSRTSNNPSNNQSPGISTTNISGQSTSTSGPPPRAQNYKTEMCYYFLKGCCNYSKEDCRFAHGQEDLRKSTSVEAAIGSFEGRRNPPQHQTQFQSRPRTGGSDRHNMMMPSMYHPPPPPSVVHNMSSHQVSPPPPPPPLHTHHHHGSAGVVLHNEIQWPSVSAMPPKNPQH